MFAGIATYLGNAFGPAAEWTAGIIVALAVLLAYLTRRAPQGSRRLIFNVSIGVLVALLAVIVVGVWVRDIWVWRKTGVWFGPSAGIIAYVIWRAWRERARN